MNKIAVFASGSGSNAQRIAEYFNNHDFVHISLILTNNSKAGVIERAKKLNIDCIVFDREQFYNSNSILNILKDYEIDFIVLAGFLWLVPQYLIKAYSNAIINIHPALLPKYGGKGMYGMNVHKAVIENNEVESGITIHKVNEEYDKGEILLQAKCKLDKNETPDSLAEKIHQLEYTHFPVIIEKLLTI